ncbi:MAG TPA: DUF2778 domain-containing protein [Mesorhizobium sp.]|uniref:DUF2778 domain-containing protein n=1 Tax=Mesorhizobium sp. TaxID=1871066 RepID=UPI002DDCF457|nr:DUF2778 domain-containing protein [Mesorhizobium sp.]HEV2507577.1 DUF2778 domain-containing protein [Mesorhizobium sp.]
MAFVREKFRGNSPASGFKTVLARSARVTAWIAIPTAGAVLAMWSLATVAGAYSAATSIRANAHFLPTRVNVAGADLQSMEAASRLKQALVAHEWTKRRQLAAAAEAADKAERLAAAETLQDPLDERFARALGTPDADRFGPGLAEPERAARVALALSAPSTRELGFANASPSPDAAAVREVLVASLVLPDQEDDADDEQQVALADTGEVIEGPDFAAVPENAPLPAYRPRAEEASKPETRRRADVEPESDDEPVRKPAKRISQPAQPVLAYAKPDNPSESGGLGQAFRNLFSSPGGSSARAGNGTAVYDIASATVTMPDGTRLEAHSGIGSMADNVRYVNQKMRGPTPPDTYKLSMRESLFHGVEAIRLTPVDGKVKHGRNGLLAHSYLLRGGRAESHGCVAFKDYKRFLAAFKQGKIKRLVVVGGGGSRPKATTVADNGRGA